MASVNLSWYSAAFYPDSEQGYLYLVKLDKPYIAGVRYVRVGGHYQMINGKRRLVGGIPEARPQYVEVYLGWSPWPWRRYDQHMSGKGAKLLRHLAAIGWPMHLEAVAPAGREIEALLKRRHNGRDLLRTLVRSPRRQRSTN